MLLNLIVKVNFLFLDLILLSCPGACWSILSTDIAFFRITKHGRRSLISSITILLKVISLKGFSDSGGSKGARGRVPSPGPNYFNFMQFLGKIDEIVCWCPPGELASPPRRNPGSATGFHLRVYYQEIVCTLGNFLGLFIPGKLIFFAGSLSYSHTERQRQRQNPGGTGKTHRTAVAVA